MPTSLTTVTAGTPIDYDALRSYCAAIEWYINEGVVANDLKSSATWVRSSRVFAPDFSTGIYENARLVSGEAHWLLRGHSSPERSVHHSQINTSITAGVAGKYVPVEGMTRTFALPVALSGAEPTHRVRVAMDWYCHELGGKGTVDEATDHCADFALFVDGNSKPSTARPLYTASDGLGGIDLIAAKQYSIRYGALVTTAGVHNIGLRIRMYGMTSGAGTDDWRHIFVWGRTASWSWFRI